MKPGRAASLGNREQLFGGEVSRLSVRALFFAGLEGYEGLPLPDATGTSAEHPGAKHGTSGSPRAQPRAAWSDSVSERDVHRALAGRYKNSTSPRLSLPTSSGMNETLNKDNSKPPRRIDAAKCHCSLKDGSNNQQGRSKTKQQGTSGWPISRRVLYALPLLDCPDDCASGACDITEQKGRCFSVTARLWLGFTITTGNMATNGLSDLDHGWFGLLIKPGHSPSHSSFPNRASHVGDGPRWQWMARIASSGCVLRTSSMGYSFSARKIEASRGRNPCA